jgi:hypothetical protein
MAITRHQKVALYWWHWRTGPQNLPWGEFWRDGARTVKIQLQDDGPLDPEVVKDLRARGYKVDGMVWPQTEGTTWGPRETAEFFKAEKDRMVRHGTNLDGADFNFEDPVRWKDIDTSGAWSESFAKRFRELCPTLPAHLDTYYGSAAGGMNLGAYTSRNFRMAIQSFWGPDGLYEDPIWRMVAWCKNAQPSIPKAQVKPVIRVSPNNSGQLPPYAEVIQDAVNQGTKGIQFYYVDGADVDRLRDLIRTSISRGVAYK